MTGGRTIFALASGRPPCAVSIIRISGPSADAALTALCGTLPAPRRAVVRSVRAPDGELLDRALVLWFPGPGSATGEDCAELQLHGSIAVVRGVEAALGGLPDLRPAKAGEFSRRALINGRIDLVQAEALADLMAAETEMQRRAALALAEGGLSKPARRWRAALLRLSAEVEAILDFEDEADVGALASGRAQRAEQAGQLFKEINTILAAPAASRLREGICVVFAGPPNAGKSTLVNALAGREVALVSDEPGTTRDLIEVPVSMHGIAWLLTDSAGLREEGAGAVEQMGIARARAAVAGSDILVWLGPQDASPAHPRLLSIESRADAPDRLRKPGTLQVSARTGEGLDDLWQALAGHAATLLPRDDQVALNARMRGLLEDCAGAVASAAREPDPVIEAEYLRTARSALDALLGNTGTEAMLDALFGSFCIGK